MTETTGSGSTTRPSIGWGPQGDEIVLRSRGWGRWLIVLFLSFWLCGWAAGEAFALWILTAPLTKGLPLPQPDSGAAVALLSGAGLFLLIWVTFWTLGGLAAMREVARLIAGWESFHFRLGECRYRTGIGPWRGRELVLTPQTVRRIGLRKRRGTLIVETERGEGTVGQYASPEERAWLREELQRVLQLSHTAAAAPVAPPRSPSAEPLSLPGPRIARDLENGETRLAYPFRSRLAGAGCLAPIALFWNAIVLTGATHPASGLGHWLFLTPFILIGLAMITGVLWFLLGSEEWVLAPGRFTVTHRFLGFQRVKSYPHGAFEVSVSTDGDGDESWSLLLWWENTSRVLQRGSATDLRTLGAFLSHRTGWPLRCDKDLE